jgi:hypothetical protein
LSTIYFIYFYAQKPQQISDYGASGDSRLLNPVQFSMDSGQDSVSLVRYILGTPASLFVLAAAWHFNRKAIRLKREDREAQRSDKSSA